MDGRVSGGSQGTSGGRAFTLIEMLVVIGVVALLVALVLPAMSGARRASQLAVSQINLKQCGDVQAAYSLDYKGSFVNPFDRRNGATLGIGWFDVLAQQSVNTPTGQPVYLYGFGDPQFSTHAFGPLWAALATQYLTANNTVSKMLFSPLDGAPLLRYQKISPSLLGINNEVLWDSSYWCPPTLWLGTEPYRTANRVGVGGLDSRYLRRNRFDDAVSPSAKAMVFERFDFSRRTRLHLAGGREDFFPMFNNPEATTRFVSVDGSVSSFQVSKLFKLTNPASATQAEIDMYTPSGPFEPSDTFWGDPDAGVGNLSLYRYALGRDGLENGDGSMLGIPGGFNRYPAFFWATRGGIQGRDIPR